MCGLPAAGAVVAARHAATHGAADGGGGGGVDALRVTKGSDPSVSLSMTAAMTQVPLPTATADRLTFLR